MRMLFGTCVLATALILPAGAAVIPAQMKGSDVSVTVTYTGKGPVDATHEIWVFLFDTPNIGPGARPMIAQTIKKSGEATVFKGVMQDPVYVAVAYDEKGDYDGNAAPPPPGTPVLTYSVDGKGTSAPVKTAGGAKIKLSFSDAQRMQ